MVGRTRQVWWCNPIILCSHMLLSDCSVPQPGSYCSPLTTLSASLLIAFRNLSGTDIFLFYSYSSGSYQGSLQVGTVHHNLVGSRLGIQMKAKIPFSTVQQQSIAYISVLGFYETPCNLGFPGERACFMQAHWKESMLPGDGGKASGVKIILSYVAN